MVTKNPQNRSFRKGKKLVPYNIFIGTKTLKKGTSKNDRSVGNREHSRIIRKAGLSKTATAQRLNLDRGTVAKYWDVEEPLKAPPVYQRSSKIDLYKEYITNRLEKWPELFAETIYEEIKKMGYKGSARTVRRYVYSGADQNFPGSTNPMKPYPVNKPRLTGATSAT